LDTALAEGRVRCHVVIQNVLTEVSNVNNITFTHPSVLMFTDLNSAKQSRSCTSLASLKIVQFSRFHNQLQSSLERTNIYKRIRSTHQHFQPSIFFRNQPL